MIFLTDAQSWTPPWSSERKLSSRVRRVCVSPVFGFSDHCLFVCMLLLCIHTNLWIGSAKSWLSRTQGSVVIPFLFVWLCFSGVRVCVRGCAWIFCCFILLSFMVNLICGVSQIYLKRTDLPLNLVVMWNWTVLESADVVCYKIHMSTLRLCSKT